MSKWCSQIQHKFYILTQRPRRRAVQVTRRPHYPLHASLTTQLTLLVKSYYRQRLSGVHLSPDPSGSWKNVLWNLVNTSSEVSIPRPLVDGEGLPLYRQMCWPWLFGHCHLQIPLVLEGLSSFVQPLAACFLKPAQVFSFFPMLCPMGLAQDSPSRPHNQQASSLRINMPDMVYLKIYPNCLTEYG